MKKKIVVIFVLAALLVATSVIIAGAGEDSDRQDITITAFRWETPFGKEGGEEGIFNCCSAGEDSDC